jgi:hypothetical protein
MGEDEMTQSGHEGTQEPALEPPPAMLYHYTRQPGLLGIVQSRSIWATKTQYLNDSQEYRHAFDMARREIDDLTSTAEHDAQRAFYARVSSAFDRVRDLTFFVASLSEDRDRLSQWRAYGSPGDAFAVGFTAAHLTRRAEDAGWQLVKCVYAEAAQRQLIRDVVRSYESQLSAAAIAVTQGDSDSVMEALSWQCVHAKAVGAPD